MREFRIGTDGLHQTAAVHFRHPQIGKHHGEVRVVFQYLQSLAAVLGHRDIFHPDLRQHGLEHRAIYRRVVRHKDTALGMIRKLRKIEVSGTVGRRSNGPDIAKRDRKGRALADFGGDGQLSAHEIGEFLADGQAEPRPFAMVPVGQLDERLEDASDVLFRNAAARVRDRQRQRAFMPADADRDRAAVRIFVGVRQQIEEDLADTLRVDAHPRHFVDLLPEGQMLVRPDDLAGGDDFAGERRDISRLFDDLQLAALQFRQVEDIVHQTREHLAARVDGRNAAGPLFLVFDPQLEQFREPGNGVERRADVMRHGREEQALGLR